MIIDGSMSDVSVTWGAKSGTGPKCGSTVGMVVVMSLARTLSTLESGGGTSHNDQPVSAMSILGAVLARKSVHTWHLSWFRFIVSMSLVDSTCYGVCLLLTVSK